MNPPAPGDSGTPDDEVVALYDPDDVIGRVVGSAPRSHVRAQNLPHAATAVFVRRSDGSVLVHRRSDAKDLWPGLHDCASGGVVLAGEDPQDAAHRELAEELGIRHAVLHPLMTSWYRDDSTHYLAHVYEAVHDGPIALRDGEVASAWWEPQAALAARLQDPGWAFVPDTRRLLRLLFGASVEGAPGAGAAARVGAADGYWPVGGTVVYRYGIGGRARQARLTRVVQHDGEGLVLWVPPGTPTVETALVDGRVVRSAELPAGAAPLGRRADRWRGQGIVMFAPSDGRGWSVWWFFDDDRRFRGWYGNLEAPQVLRRTAEGSCLVDSADRALDVVVAPDGSSRWKDEDEFAALTGRPGRWSPAQVPLIRADGEALRMLARRRLAPFDGRWTDVDPDPAWNEPAAWPPDWDVPHLAGP